MPGISSILQHTVQGTGGQRRPCSLHIVPNSQIKYNICSCCRFPLNPSHRPSDVTDLRQRISSCVLVLHISEEIFDQFFTEVHSRSSTQQCSPTPLCIKTNVSRLCQFAHSLSLSVTWQDRDPQLPAHTTELGLSHWGLHSSCEDEPCTIELAGSENLTPLRALLGRSGVQSSWEAGGKRCRGVSCVVLSC